MTMATTEMASAGELEERVRSLDPWFHDLDLHGVHTAPDHPLGNFLRDLWAQVEPAFPRDMRGKTVLDIGCNAGFYSLQLHARGARVTGIEHDAHYLAQARFAAEVLDADIDYRLMDVYDVDQLGQQFDYVLFMGVLYHLRYPLYALDKVARLPREKLVFQSMLRGSTDTSLPIEADYPITEREIFDDSRFPAMYFLEHRYAGDPTNWWVPNQPGMEAMLRSAGLRIDGHVGSEVYFCSPARG
ncbi:MAG TPA: TIGR04290 family methyltransferase [Longimicrobiaceae bacterium]|nr:TIGR04290 family methyltransferase [Longimicrobiaceae bacterium]